MDGGKVKLDLKACKNCGRTFVPESLAKHQKVCKSITQQRKPFDMAKQRVTDDLSLRDIKKAQKQVVKPPKSHWKAKHQEFISNVRAARGAQVAIDRGDPLPPPPPPSLNPDYIACPHCARRFSEKAAERHISFCKEQQLRTGGNKRQPTEAEKKRAAAKSYQAPRPVGRGASPGMGGGYADSPPSSGRGGYSNSPAARGTRPAPEASRGPGSGGMIGGVSSRGRAPVGGATRGKPAPASQTGLYAGHQVNNNSTVACNLHVVGSGPALRTGRDGQVHEEANREARERHSRPVDMTTYRARDDMLDSQTITPKRVSSGYGRRNTESGYHSSSSDLDTYGTTRTNYQTTPSKFCHECGAKYPIPSAKFCCECGIQRIT